MLKNKGNIIRGDIYITDLGERTGSHDAVQRGRRPVVVVSNNAANKFSPAVTIVPLTSSTSKHDLPTHSSFYLNNHGNDVLNTALCEQVQTVNVYQLLYCVGSVSPDVMKGIDHSLKVAIGLWSFLLPTKSQAMEWL